MPKPQMVYTLEVRVALSHVEFAEGFGFELEEWLCELQSRMGEVTDARVQLALPADGRPSVLARYLDPHLEPRTETQEKEVAK